MVAHEYCCLTTRRIFDVDSRRDVAVTLQGAIITYEQNSADPFTGLNYTGAEDTWIFFNPPSTDERGAGGDLRFIVGSIGSGGGRHGLMRFNLASLAGKYASIDSVTLRLYWNTPAGAADTVQVYAVSAANSNWVEGNNQITQSASLGTSSWEQKRAGSQNWAGSLGASTPGVDYDTTLLASNSYTGSETAGTAFDLTFTDPAIISLWLGANGGIFVRTASETHQAQFRSSEFASFEPELIINYSAVPEPSSFALVAVVMSGGACWKRRRKQRAACSETAAI